MLDVVADAAERELGAVKQRIREWRIDPCVLLIQVVRFCDYNLVHQWIDGPPSDLASALRDQLYRLGLNPLLALLLPAIPREPFIPLMASNNDAMNMVGVALGHLGRVRLLQRYLRLASSGLFIATREGIKLEFRRADVTAGVEMFEHLDREWSYREFVAKEKRVPRRIQKQMHSLVNRWRNDYIAYDTTPAIDAHFLRRALVIFDEERDLYGIAPKFRFGSLSGAEINLVSAMLCSVFIKHVYFCFEYLRKFPGAHMPNILTIWSERRKLTDELTAFGRELQSFDTDADTPFGLTRGKVYRCLAALSLNRTNVIQHTSRFVTPMPALIAVRRNFWIHSIASLAEGPLAFGAKEFRRAFPKAWDKNIRQREGWFRNDLYALFSGNRYICLDSEAQLSMQQRTITDVDAAIVDVMTGRLALFELKWQEPFGVEESERRNRARNLRSEVTKWTRQVTELLSTQGIKVLIEQLGFPAMLRGYVRNVDLFVVVRHNARFSGFSIGNSSVVVSSWNQLRRARIELGSVDDTFSSLFNRLKEEEVRMSTSSIGTAEFSVAGFEIRADHFYVAGERDDA